MQDFVNNLIPTIRDLGDTTYLIIFVICILETIPFAGVILPATVVLAVAGFFASLGFLDAKDLIWVATIGAIIGDALSFYIGKFGGQRMFSETARFFKTKYIDKAESFFERHGGKSVFWGRFISPIRPFIGFAAGIGKMDQKRFWVFNVASAPVWATIFVMVGFLFGEGWQAAVSWIDKIILLSLCVIVLAIAVNIVIRKFFFRNKNQ
ncbi:MAG: DedA family protein [Minisyncoccia bacterium]|jgi:membrane protein DedA with SNARE-associated domain